MAVAVKNNPVTSPRWLSDSLAAGSWLGTVYLYASLALIFYLLPWLWRSGLEAVHLNADSPVSWSLLILVMLVAAMGLIIGGLRLVGPQPAHGIRAGIFVGFWGVLVILLLTFWIGAGIENLIYRYHPFGDVGRPVGIGLTIAVGLILLGLGVYYFTRPRFEKGLLAFEDQGWFTATPYKRSQGLRVRRGTILGILILAGCGLYTLLSHRTLETGSENWEVNIPFTGWVLVQDTDGVGDMAKVQDAGESSFQAGQVVPRQAVEAEAAKLTAAGKAAPTFLGVEPGLWVDRFTLAKINRELSPGVAAAGEPPMGATGLTVYRSLVLLPDLKITLILLLAFASLWISYRVVSFPVFADFLIATEAEMNKVSWTPRRRLINDTVVVLVTVLLLTVFLFGVDQLWAFVLTKIHVVQVPTQSQTASQKELPW
ncbi:MAG: preprotein translocase subunit SecE [Planctomycetes bacterium]|nr:preprotein translocase subunit SecE [Planctomycetota bacterium]